jgi:hypothetical protein
MSSTHHWPGINDDLEAIGPLRGFGPGGNNGGLPPLHPWDPSGQPFRPPWVIPPSTGTAQPPGPWTQYWACSKQTCVPVPADTPAAFKTQTASSQPYPPRTCVKQCAFNRY